MFRTRETAKVGMRTSHREGQRRVAQVGNGGGQGLVVGRDWWWAGTGGGRGHRCSPPHRTGGWPTFSLFTILVKRRLGRKPIAD